MGEFFVTFDSVDVGKFVLVYLYSSNLSVCMFESTSWMGSIIF